MDTIAANFTITTAQLAGLGALLATALLIAQIGRSVAGPTRLAVADVIFGWAVVSPVFTTMGAQLRRASFMDRV